MNKIVYKIFLFLLFCLFTNYIKAQESNPENVLVCEAGISRLINIKTKQQKIIKESYDSIFVLGNNSIGLIKDSVKYFSRIIIIDTLLKKQTEIADVFIYIQVDYNSPFLVYTRNKAFVNGDIPNPLDEFEDNWEAYSPEGKLLFKTDTLRFFHEYKRIVNGVIVTKCDNPGLLAPIVDPYNIEFEIINDKGKIVTNSGFSRVIPCENGVCAVEKHGKWGFADETGMQFIDFKYDYAKDWKDGYGIVQKNKKWGITDKNDSLIVPVKFKYIDWGAEGQLLIGYKIKAVHEFFFKKYFYVRNFNVYDIEAKEKISKKKMSIYLKGNNIYSVWSKKTHKYQLYDRNLELITDKLFDSIYSFTGDYAAASVNKKWGVINKKGEWILKPVYDSIIGFM